MPVAKSGFSPAQAVHVMQADMPASEATLQKAVQTTEQQAEQEAISTTCSVQPAPCVTRAGCMYTVSSTSYSLRNVNAQLCMMRRRSEKCAVRPTAQFAVLVDSHRVESSAVSQIHHKHPQELMAHYVGRPTNCASGCAA